MLKVAFKVAGREERCSQVTVLKACNITIAFGGLKAVSNFNLTLQEGELAGLIGPNGAGKTTVFNLLTAVYPSDTGEIFFYNRDGAHGKNIVGLQPYQVTRMGMARTFQNIRLFKDLSVLDNVKIAYHFKAGCNSGAAIFRTSRFYQAERKIERKALELLALFNLATKAATAAKNLPYGEQRQLEIIRALATTPHLLLLDEPAAGMNQQETRGLMKLIRRIREQFNLTILLIEHDMHLVMEICEWILVLDYGQTIAEGTPDQISGDARVIQAYLGEEPDNSA
jgi:branched-chain amino acid transport system ATP-binding protein